MAEKKNQNFVKILVQSLNCSILLNIYATGPHKHTFDSKFSVEFDNTMKIKDNFVKKNIKILRIFIFGPTSTPHKIFVKKIHWSIIDAIKHIELKF